MAVRQPRRLENILLKPYFWRRPSQVLRRLLYAVPAWPDPALVRLPWGLRLECNPSEMIGQSIIHTGVFEMATTEALVRLVDPGELVLDIGANIGYMTSLLACASGPGGRVIAYEPNPAVYQQLAENVRRWDRVSLGTIELRQAALSDREGTAWLTIPQGGSEWATLSDHPVGRSPAATHSTVPVRVVTLDRELKDQSVGVLKLDVEDHEPAALRGAQAMLEKGRIRDILFEDHNSYPSETTAMLEQRGYSVFDIAARPLGLVVDAPELRSVYASWHAPMRLATLDPVRAKRRLSVRGWISLGNAARWHKPSAYNDDAGWRPTR